MTTVNNLKIAFIIPNYNKGQYISYCIESIENQTISPNEIIIIDDCSSDNSLDIIASLTCKYRNIKLLVNDYNRGVSFSRNRGVKYSKSDYLCFLDSDDYIDNPFFIEHLIPFIRPKRICYMKYKYFDVNQGYYTDNSVKKIDYNKKLSKPRMKIIVCTGKPNYLMPRNYIVSKKVFYKSGLFDENMNLYEDSDLMCRLLKYARPIVLNEYGPVYRITPDGLSKADGDLHYKVLSILKKKYFDWKCELLLWIGSEVK